MEVCVKEGETLMDRKRPEKAEQFDDNGLNHVGGISDDLSGIDPQIDENLRRLSWGP
jgi:hypothetical protein